MSRRIRTLIVDDIALARERVARYLAEEPDVALVGEAATGAEALRLIAGLGPDLVLLDVGLPDVDGFEIARRLPHASRPLIVYLTAHGEQALEGFDVSALDYLAKPVGRERFARALDRAREALRLRAGAALGDRPDYLRRIAVRERDRTDLVDLGEVDYIDVGGHYLGIHVGTRVHLLRGRLSEIEARLDPGEFVRVHRSSIVRRDRVRQMAARRNGDCDLILADGSRVLMSRTYRDSLIARLSLTSKA